VLCSVCDVMEPKGWLDKVLLLVLPWPQPSQICMFCQFMHQMCQEANGMACLLSLAV
jgi:hypothetical protein